MTTRKNIFLTGFMGAGKTTTGISLAEMMGYKFLDLDALIVDNAGCSITEIFVQYGEAYFRDLETETLAGIDSRPSTVIATGGGAVISEHNRLLMRRSGIIVYLDTQWETLKNRLVMSRDRPLVDPGNNWDDVFKRWQSRQGYYSDADYVVHTDGLNPEQVAREIQSLLIAGET